MSAKKKWELKGDIIALDIETERAVYGERPVALCVCLHIPALRYAWQSTTWGPGCITEAHYELVRLRKSRKDPFLIIAHNGGKFDFGYFAQDEGAKRLVGSRLLQTSIAGIPALDTMLLMPTALRNLGSKGETDLNKHALDADLFDQQMIKAYCLQDCIVLARAYMRFAKVFTGDETAHPKATAASNAFAALRDTLPTAHPSLWKNTGVFDATIRPYYHGGIVNTFGPARDIAGDFWMVDANSMYPGAMKNFRHPASNRFVKVAAPKFDGKGNLKGYSPDRFYFVRFEGWAKLLPHCKPTGGLEYDVEGEYFVTCHEFKAALRHGFVRVDSVIECLVFPDTVSFGQFVDTYYTLRQECKATKDPVEYVYKIVLNSAYGKFGMDPRNYGEHASTWTKDAPENSDDCTPWKYVGCSSDGTVFYWSRDKILDPNNRDFINVATAASITGAARATLIDAVGAIVAAGGTVHYTDTDSICAEGSRGNIDLGDELGQWKLEGEFDRVIIAGPKLYAFHNPHGPYHEKNKEWKLASKGVRATPEQIIDLVSGAADLEHFPEVGSHDWRGRYKTVKRTIRRETIHK